MLTTLQVFKLVLFAKVLYNTVILIEILRRIYYIETLIYQPGNRYRIKTKPDYP